MLPADKLRFLFNALDVGNLGEVAESLQISQGHLSNILLCRHSPSLSVAIKIEELLQRRWRERNGETIPPEVSQIVFRLLYPPPPFDPNSGKPRRRSTNCSAQAVDNGRREAAPAGGIVATTQGAQVFCAAAQKTQPDAEIGSLRGCAENPTPLIRTEADAIQAVKELHRRGSRHAEGRALADAVRAALPSYSASPDPLRRLRRKAGIEGRIRKRAPVASVQNRRDAIMSIVEPAYAWLRKNNTQSKGADDLHSFGWMTSTVDAILSDPQVRQKLESHPDIGHVPEPAAIIRLLRERGHRVDPREECQDYIQRMAGWRPSFAGQVVMADATGFPIHAGRELAPGTTAKERKKLKLWMHVGLDPASAYTWIGYDYADTETAGWAPFLQRWLLNDLRYAPESLVVDKVSGIFAALTLLDGDRNGIETVPPAVLLWLSAGVTPHITTPERATAKAHVETANRVIKHGDLNRICVRRIISKQLAGEGVGQARRFETSADLGRVMDDLRAVVNQRILGRAGQSRGEVWACAEDAALRSARALADDASERWMDIVARTKVVRVAGKRIAARIGGIDYGADLDTALPFKADECLAVLSPCGLRMGDDPASYRVLAIEDTAGAGVPKFHQLTARAAARDRFGFDVRLPLFGQGHKARPDTLEQRVQRQRDAAAQQHAEAIGALQKQRQSIEEEFTNGETTEDLLEAGRRLSGATAIA